MAKPESETPKQRMIGLSEAGQRLDRAVGEWLGLSRAAVLRLLDAGGVRCNGRVVPRSAKGRCLQVGDALAINAGFADRDESPLPDHTLDLLVVAQGPGWIVVNKPAGVPVRPHALDETGTVLNAVAARHPDIVGVGEGGLRSGVVHRLDNDTSGVLAFAVIHDAWPRLREDFAEHRVMKRYHALLHGRLEPQGRSVQCLRIRQHAPARVESCGDADTPGVRRCSLDWRVLEYFADQATWVEINLHTGFLHQIRVMMAHLGHPVIGDPLYGQGQPSCEAKRQMLHAAELLLDGVTARAPLPNDFEQMIHRLRTHTNPL